MNVHAQSDRFAALRQQMVATQLRARGISDQRVLDAFLRVPRHEFIPEPYRARAHEDHPLPIGDGQTISQPYIVAIMLQALELKPTDKVLARAGRRSAASLNHAGLHQCRNCHRRRYRRLARSRALRRHHRLRRHLGTAAGARLATPRRRAHDHPSRPRRVAATSINSCRERTSADFAARSMPICPADLGWKQPQPMSVWHERVA